tara:strand:+ start:1159 stop:1455 length:297 start_codon:yes stop_codon:yes gene_type:complete
MATINTGTRFDVSSRTTVPGTKYGDYNRVTTVAASTTQYFSGSQAASAFIVGDPTNVTITAVNGGTLPAAALAADTFYPVAPSQVTIGGTGVVHVLHK